MEASPHQAPEHARTISEGERVELERIHRPGDCILPVRVLGDVLHHPAPGSEGRGPGLIHLLQPKQIIAPDKRVKNCT